MTSLPIARPVARATSSASGEESMPAMTSTRRMTGAGLKKCMPTTRPGSAAALAIAVIGIDEVLEASTARGAISPRAAKSSRLSSRRSGAASMTSPAGASSASSAAAATSPGSRSRRPFARQRSRPSAICRRPRSRASGTGSCSSVRAPAAAASCAIPAPMVPAPTTPMTSGIPLTLEEAN